MIFNMSGGGAAVKTTAISSIEDLPETAGEGTLAIITDIDIAKTIVSNTEPANPEEGEIWITISPDDSGRAVDLKGDGSILIPTGAIRQWNGEEWVSCEYRIMFNGSWESVTLDLLKDGADRTPDGWSFTGTGTWTKTDGRWGITDSFGGTLTTNHKIANAYSSLKFDGYSAFNNPGFNEYGVVEVIDASTNAVLKTSGALGTSRSTKTIDVSNIRGRDIKVRFSSYGSTAYGVANSVYAYNIWFT